MLCRRASKSQKQKRKVSRETTWKRFDYSEFDETTALLGMMATSAGTSSKERQAARMEARRGVCSFRSRYPQDVKEERVGCNLTCFAREGDDRFPKRRF